MTVKVLEAYANEVAEYEAKKERMHSAIEYVRGALKKDCEAAVFQNPQLVASTYARIIEAMTKGLYNAFDFLNQRKMMEFKKPSPDPSTMSEDERVLAMVGHKYLHMFESLVEGKPMEVSFSYFEEAIKRYTDDHAIAFIPEYRNGTFVVGKIADTATQVLSGVEPTNTRVKTPLARLKQDFGFESGAPVPLDLQIKRI